MIKKILKNIWIFVKLGRFQKITLHRLNMLQLAFQYVKNEKVPGEYFEFGVARGLTFAGAYQVSKKYNAPVSKFHAFDSFQGFPELGEVDSEFERFKTGEESWNLKEFNKTLKKASVPREKVEIYPGWFKDTLTVELQKNLRGENKKAAIIWVDCDLYKSAKEVMNFIRPVLQNGTVVVFDDWYCYHADPNKGEQRALSEFLELHPEVDFIQYKKFGIVGNSFIVNIRDDEEKN
jgi:hypothetical protein